ncbi:MAG TPA: GNAT family N-acetyltransferase [Blastocatellia bacterium]|nr:GNAT family N-acetyltransferase [Blastocatellia bacterium]
MSVSADPTKLQAVRPSRIDRGKSAPAGLSELKNSSTVEVLRFLSARPFCTFGLMGYILDNGIESDLNRGKFHGYRDERGRLEGVALIGRHTLFEARSERALSFFAAAAQQCAAKHLVLGEENKVDRFWRYYQQAGLRPRRACRELLMELRFPITRLEPVPQLRRATLGDLDLIVEVNAEMAREESGINPLEVDPYGFRMRCTRRVELGRVWVWVEGGRLIFKSDLMSNAPQVAYLEGVWAHPDERGKGYVTRCLNHLACHLLERDRSICILVNENKEMAQRVYLAAGFRFICYYSAIFL